MSAIAGLVRWQGAKCDENPCGGMLEALAPFGLRSSTRTLGCCGFGHVRSSPEVDGTFEGHPVHDKEILLVADVRLDNRDELIELLGWGGRETNGLSDADILLRCWQQWGEAAPTKLLGDYAFAVWDDRTRELKLARSPATTRPLFYHAGQRLAAFASMPQALHALRAFPKKLNIDELGRRLWGGTYFGSRETAFAEVECVDPGTIVHVSADGVRVARFWDPTAIATVRRKPEDAARQLRAEFERAVRASLRGDGPIASHLSGGRDSGAVASCAADILAGRGEQLVAYTAAPRTGFPEGGGRYRHDESALAAKVAEQFPNVRHVVSRSRPVALCDALDRASAVHFAPMGNPANEAYWTRILEAASAAGSRVLLTGANGNFSISIGGPAALADVLREDGFRSWWRAARRSGLSWRTLLNQSLGHLLPAPVHRWLRRRLVADGVEPDYPLFKGPLRQRVERDHGVAETRPSASYRATVRDIYRTVDYADKVGLALHGIELRDPTADRRLIEYSLSLPASQIAGSQGQRPIYDLAFADLVPAEVRENRRKGFQGADWFEIYDPEEIRAGFRRYNANRLVRDLIDLGEAEKLLDRWPTERGFEIPTYNLYANHLLVALALASWVDVHFPEERD